MPFCPRSGSMTRVGHARMQLPQRMQMPANRPSSTDPGGRSGRGAVAPACRTADAHTAPTVPARTARRGKRQERSAADSVDRRQRLGRSRQAVVQSASCKPPNGQSRWHQMPGRSRLRRMTLAPPTRSQRAPGTAGGLNGVNRAANHARGSSQRSTGYPRQAPPRITIAMAGPKRGVRGHRRPSFEPRRLAVSAQSPGGHAQRQNQRCRTTHTAATAKPARSIGSTCRAETAEAKATSGLNAGTKTAARGHGKSASSASSAAAKQAMRTNQRRQGADTRSVCDSAVAGSRRLNPGKPLVP